MNTIVFPEDVIGVIRSFYLCNQGDESTTALILDIGSELLDVSPDTMLELINVEE